MGVGAVDERVVSLLTVLLVVGIFVEASEAGGEESRVGISILAMVSSLLAAELPE